MSVLRSFLAWTRTVPRNLASLRPHLDARWTHGYFGLGILVYHNFDRGDEHYLFHFSWCYLGLQVGPLEFQVGIEDTN